MDDGGGGGGEFLEGRIFELESDGANVDTAGSLEKWDPELCHCRQVTGNDNEMAKEDVMGECGGLEGGGGEGENLALGVSFYV